MVAAEQPQRRYVVVSFHAHPDDEALYTGGTLARCAAEGHRVVLVVATSGESGLAAALPAGEPLGRQRVGELDASARALGVGRLVLLGYGDSGSDGRAAPSNPPFARADVEEAARRLADVLVEERADVLTTYDRLGGYGHPDHVQVHRVGARAAEIAGTPVVLEATVDRDALRPAMRLVTLLRRFLPGLHVPPLERSYTPRNQITHRVDVRRYADAKRRALEAHASQATSPSGVRTVALLLRLPGPLFRRVLGFEWYVERGRAPARPPSPDVFASLRGGAAEAGGGMPHGS